MQFNVKDEFRDSLKSAINEVFDERTHVDSVTHKSHHEFIERFMREYEETRAAEKASRERREVIFRQILGWSIISALVAIGDWVVGHLHIGLGQDP